ncbi:MAG: type II toxin-antitoxin system RelE/ParE family toxin [Deferribacteres bacterium]|nr:type II toxin-antitoxin system RelE/ParE family toxin [Deferribacteres bacterium]
MKFSVSLVIDAERDIRDIYRYAARKDSEEKAYRLLYNLEKTVMSLETMPLKGHFPPELERIGVFEFREIFFKPYRIIYQVVKSRVYVHCVLDGRGDLQDLLQERLLR